VSPAERPEFTALRDLEEVVARISEELETFRRRAHRAEAERAELGGTGDLESARHRVEDLEDENEELRKRVDHARQRVKELVTRLRFLEEQMTAERTATG
jgi:predicted  nucleic acid-binding Zn-ribbon protein